MVASLVYDTVTYLICGHFSAKLHSRRVSGTDLDNARGLLNITRLPIQRRDQLTADNSNSSFPKGYLPDFSNWHRVEIAGTCFHIYANFHTATYDVCSPGIVRFASVIRSELTLMNAGCVGQECYGNYTTEHNKHNRIGGYVTRI